MEEAGAGFGIIDRNRAIADTLAKAADEIVRMRLIEAERDLLRAENEMPCLHGAEPTDEGWALLRAEREEDPAP